MTSRTHTKRTTRPVWTDTVATVPAIQPVRPQTAARAVYDTPELRQRIIGYMSRHDLTRLARVEQKCLFDVASVLYRQIEHSQVVTMKNETEQQRIYCNAVTEIYAYMVTMSPSLRRALRKILPNFNGLVREYLPELVPPLISSIRKKCRNARVVHVGDEVAGTERDAWQVHLPRRPGGSGEIRLAQVLVLHSDQKPPSRLPIPSAPTGYAMTYSFNLQMDDGRHLAGVTDFYEAWRRLFREDEGMGYIDEEADFGYLPLEIGTLSQIYDRQDRVGKGRRLKDVKVERAAPFDIQDFRTFASVASTSLTSLKLADNTLGRHVPQQVLLTFADLPALVTVIKEALPNVDTLSFNMWGIDISEALCRHPTEDSFSGGRVKDLYISGERTPEGPINLIRYLSSICAASPVIEITSGNDIDWYENNEDELPRDSQSDYLKFLQKQPLERRRHLAVVDFSSLDVGTIADVYDLEYEEDGTPIRRGPRKIGEWSKKIRFAQTSLESFIPSLQEHIDSSASVLDGLSTATACSKEETLARAKTLMTTLAQLQELSRRCQGLLDGEMVSDVADFVRSLEKIQSEEMGSQGT